MSAFSVNAPYFAFAAKVCYPPFVSIDMNGPEPTFEQLAAKGCFEPTPDNRQPAAESTNSLPVFVQPINSRQFFTVVFSPV